MDRPPSPEEPDFKEEESELIVDNMTILISHYDGYITGISIETPLAVISIYGPNTDITCDQGSVMLTESAMDLIQGFADENGLNWTQSESESESEFFPDK
jgi:hypothetical protein